MFAAVVGQSWATAAHPYSLEINGVDVIGSTDMDSIRVEMAGPGTNGSISFSVADPSLALAVAAWDEVRFIEHAATRPILFGGFVQAVRLVAWATGGRDVEVTCTGYGILLDKRTSPTAFAPRYENNVGHDIVSTVGQYGGRLSALMPSSAGYTDTTYSVPYNAAWRQDPVTYSAGSSLRAIIDAATGNGYYEPVIDSTMGATTWVDSAARVCALPDWPADVSGADALYGYEGGTVPGLTVDTSGTVRLTELTYQEEDSDLYTSAYVAAANDGAGWYRTPAPERAGDLETYTAGGALLRTIEAGKVLNPVLGRTVSGTIGIASTTPVDCWPGRNVRVTAAQLGLSAADFRIGGVRIAFQSGTHREYTIDYGGSLPGSFARRSGRYANLPR